MSPGNHPRAKTANGRAANLDTITIDMSDTISRADDDRYGSLRCLFRRPDEASFRQWLARSARLTGEQRSRPRAVRRRRIVVCDNNGRAGTRD